ncbi:ABC transporter substrate-binding protein [Humibacter sp. RRB41]|uniref:ABC transporter substrate-binding protein n=1 Tax=Humibacter sp. RRB41 TaxID=2919946 RepID=UPI001FAA1032|nr:ABC transporter substrate-binding protein [Humibacter sp. RRB41]
MRRITTAAAVIAAAALVLTGCSSPSSNSTTKAGGTLTILTPSTTVSLDPASSQNLATTTLGLLDRRLTTWEVQPGKDAKVVPDLATNTGVVSDGGKTWTYTLKSGVKFSDGKAITSEDVKYGVERSFSNQLQGGLSYHKTLLVGGSTYEGPFTGKDLPSISTPDDKTIVFHLDKSFGDWPWIASMPAFTPVEKANGNPATYAKAPITSGPYKVESIKDGTSLTLVRNKYWSSKTDSVRTATADKVVFQESQNQTTAVQNLINDTGAYKDAFGAQYLGASDLASVNANSSAKQRVATSSAGPIQYLSLNTQRGELKNLQVRQAIEYAVDKKSYLVASGGAQAGTLASTLITPGIAGRVNYNLYKAPSTGDVSKAKSLLAKAGVTSLNLTLLTQNDTASTAQAQAIQEGLKRVGITVTLKPEDADSFYTDVAVSNPTFDLAMMSWQPDFPSANANISPLFDSSQIGNGNYNVSQYSNRAVDTAIAAAQAEVDQKKAQSDWAAIDKQIMADAPVVPLIYAKQSFLHGSGVGNFFIPSFPAYPDYMTLTLSK